MPQPSPGAQARRRWDEACARADSGLRAGRSAAQAAGRSEEWLVRWFTTELGQLAALRTGVNGKRRRPGGHASGLLHDFPPDLQLPSYRESLAALEEVQRLYDHGIDVEGWDWAEGFPPGWTASPKDRLKAVLPWHVT
ncbi:MAG: hypothetical protein WCD35_03705 [Mycobacteriales bacterium]